MYFNFLLYKTNRFHVAVRLFSNSRSQRTSKCGKNISDTLGCASCATFLFLPHFDVICDLLLNRRTATWNLFVNYLTPYHVYITCEILHNVTRRRIQKQRRLKWCNNIEGARASIDLSFASFLDSCQSNRPNEERWKSRHFSILMKAAKSWKKPRNFLFWLFREKWNRTKTWKSWLE